MIILTGASGGIGREILPMLSKLDNVIALYHSNPPDITHNPRITNYKLNLTSEQDVKDFGTLVKKDFKNITLIHAATKNKSDLVAQCHTSDWDEIMDVNLRGTFFLNRELLIPMISEKWGRIIHFSSITSLRGMPGTLAYSTAKNGLIGMSRVIAREHARFGITSNVLALGYFNTGIVDTLSEKVRKKIIDELPSKKLGDPSNIFNAIEFLIKSEYTNGSVLNIDGAL